LKTCFKCDRELPLAEFYPHPRMADGHLNKCKDCTRADVKANRAVNREHYHTYDRERRKDPQYRAQRREWRRNVPRTRKTAWAAVERALKNGVLVPQPCEICGDVRVEAHHEDYSQPLAVRWLCFAHHREVGHHQTVTAPRRCATVPQRTSGGKR
jgi:hypothetical protein